MTGSASIDEFEPVPVAPVGGPAGSELGVIDLREHDLGAGTAPAPLAVPDSRPTLHAVPPRLIDPGPDCRYRSWRLALKWVFDRILGLVAMVVLFPVLVLVAALVLVTSGRPVLFSQARIGRNGRVFTIYKFRTMRPDAEQYLIDHPELAALYRDNDFKLPVGEDVRVTRLGRLLRRTSLDELPQLFNIIRGDMSFVGPRPVLAEELARYGPYRDMYERAYPGLTGAWQVAGRTGIRYPERARLDAEYVEQWSLIRDVWIVLQTIPALFDPGQSD